MKNLESIRRLSAFSNFSLTTTPGLNEKQHAHAQKYANAASRKFAQYHNQHQSLQTELQTPLLNVRPAVRETVQGGAGGGANNGADGATASKGADENANNGADGAAANVKPTAVAAAAAEAEASSAKPKGKARSPRSPRAKAAAAAASAVGPPGFAGPLVDRLMPGSGEDGGPFDPHAPSFPQYAQSTAVGLNNLLYTPVRNDRVDETMASAINTARPPIPFYRLSSGVYLYGSRKVMVKLRNNKLVMRMGGGFTSFEEFLNKYTAEELQKMK